MLPIFSAQLPATHGSPESDRDLTRDHNRIRDSLWERIAFHAARAGQTPALLEPDQPVLSYAQLHRALQEMAALLEAAVSCKARWSCALLSLLGVSSFCAVAALNPALTAAELKADLLQLGVQAIVLMPENSTVASVARKLGLLVVEAMGTREGYSWHIAGQPRSIVRAAESMPGVADAKVLLHTSATTGRKKIVPLTAGNLHSMLRNTCGALALTRQDRLLCMARLFHTQGILSPLAQIMAGGSVIMAPQFTPSGFSSWIDEFDPTWYTCGPTLHRAILNHVREHPLLSTNSPRFVRSGGAPLTNELRDELQRTLNVPTLDVYGLTETGAVACTTPDMLCWPRQIGSYGVGKSMGPGLAIMAPDGIPLEAQEEGEIVVSGPSVMTGYRNDPVANREAFHGEWFRTGDLGKIDQDGFLHVTGRLKEIINRGGQKIIPDEIDAVLMSHPAVKEVAAFGVPHPSLGEDVMCAVVLHEPARENDLELRTFAAKALAGYKVPRKIYFVRSIPRGSTGKPQRLTLRADATGSDTGGAARRSKKNSSAPVRKILAPPREQTGPLPTDIGRSIEDIWRHCTHCDEADKEQDFFLEGGDSLSAVAMFLEIETLLSLTAPLPLASFFAHSTLAALHGMVAAAIAGRVVEAPSNVLRLIPLTQTYEGLPFFMIPGDGEEGSAFRQLSRHLGEAQQFALLRPGSTWHTRSADSIQVAAAQAAALISSASKGPSLVGGFCYGGVVAFEAVRQLERQGHAASLVLFDVPTPGRPHLLWQWRVYLCALAESAMISLQTASLRPLGHLVRRISSRMLWFILRRAALSKYCDASSSFWRWLRKAAEGGYFPIGFRPVPIHAPVLHFTAQDEPDSLIVASRYAWKKLSKSEVTMVSLPGEHHTLIVEKNLSSIQTFIMQWLQNARLPPTRQTNAPAPDC